MNAVFEWTDDTIPCEDRRCSWHGNRTPVKITLYQGLPKGDKMEMIVQKRVEL